MSKVGIVIITYNAPRLLVTQLQCVRRFCLDDHDIIIVDNSNDPEAIEAIKYHSAGCIYIKSNATSHGGSESHAFAANLSYTKLKDDYEYLFYLDHDAFPFKPFSVVEILGDKAMAGLAQKKVKLYYWPGCFMFDAVKVRNVDFSPSPGMDTGGGTWRLIKKHGEPQCVFFSEEYHQNPHFKKSQYDFYSVIGGVFMHFLNGSNWAKSNHNEERVNSLLNILEQRINETSGGNILP